jgi:hypothetical protein
MRWLVEVTSLGKAEKDSLYVDADSWQKALQLSRSLRGESEPLSGFSIELLDEGCRAVDPVSRVSYEVRRAQEDGRVIAPRPPPSRPKAAGHESGRGPAANPPRPSQAPHAVSPGHASVSRAQAAAVAPAPAAVPQTQAPVVAPAPAAVPQTQAPVVAPAPAEVPQAQGAVVAPTPSVMVGPARVAAPAAAAAATIPQTAAPQVVATAQAAVPSQGPAPQPDAARSQAQAAPKPVFTATSTMIIGSPAPPVVAPARASENLPAAVARDAARNLPTQIVFRREQDATEALPLTYREYVYVVPPGSTEVAAGTLVHSQFDLVRASLDRMPAGKLVNLAVFDAVFQGKPTVPPLATLTWKDWRGTALVSFPRQPGRPPVPIPTPAVALAAPAVAVAAESKQPSRPPPAPASLSGPWAAAVVAPAPVFPPAPTLAAPSPPPNTPFAAPPANPFAEAPANPFAAAPTAPLAVAAIAGAFPQGEVPIVPMGRVHGEDLIADLFESMHDLHFARDAVEGGDFCLALATEKLASLVGIIEVFDITRREFLVTNTRGEGAGTLLLRRFPENDGILAAAMRKRQAVVVENALEGEAATNERYATIGGARSLIVAPIMQAGRLLGAIELLNPTDGRPFTESDGNAVTYIAQQLAAFVSERGMVLDPERIGGRQRH